MPSAVGPGGLDYLWRDGSTSSLAPPSDDIDTVLRSPTRLAQAAGTAISYDRIYREQPFIGGAIRFLAGQVARLPLKAFIRVGDDDRRRDHDSAFARALRRPSPRRSAHVMKRDIAMGLLTHGNHLEEIVKTGAKLNLRKITWSKCRPKWNEQRTQILGWEIHDQAEGDPPRDLSNLDVLHFALGNTEGPLGISPLEQLGITVRIDRYVQAHQIATFKNGARPGVLVKIDPKASAANPGLSDAVRTEFEYRYAGPGNSGRPYVAGGVDLAPFPQQTLVEAELIKQKQFSREEAAAVFQLPTIFMGDMAQATQNNYGEAYKQLFKTTLAEPLDLIVSTFDAHLLDEHPGLADPDTYCEFDINAILFGDPLERGKAYEGLLAVGGITINEIRGLENRPKFKGEWADTAMLKISNFARADAADSGADQPPEDEPTPPAE